MSDKPEWKQALFTRGRMVQELSDQLSHLSQLQQLYIITSYISIEQLAIILETNRKRVTKSIKGNE